MSPRRLEAETDLRRLSICLPSPEISEEFGFWLSFEVTTHNQLGAPSRHCLKRSHSLGKRCQAIRVPDQVLSGEGLRLEVCPSSPDEHSVLGGCDQKHEFDFCFLFIFATVIDTNARLVPTTPKPCGSHSAFPVLLEPFGKGYVSGCGRLIAQTLHWKNVEQPDVKRTSRLKDIQPRVTAWIGEERLSYRTPICTQCYPTSKSKCLSRSDFQTGQLPSLIFYWASLKKKASFGGLIGPRPEKWTWVSMATPEENVQ